MDAKHNWLRCSANRQPHEPEKLMLTQIIPCSGKFCQDYIMLIQEDFVTIL